MNDVPIRIAEGLERVFASEGFAEPGVDRLREAADVSLRTLYKYCPSREAMIVAALRRRQARYVARLFADLPGDPVRAIATILDRCSEWMRTNSANGCLFLSALAAHPNSASVRAVVEGYKTEMEERLGAAVSCPDLAGRLLLIHEGLIQIWPLRSELALDAARALAIDLVEKRRGAGPA